MAGTPNLMVVVPTSHDVTLTYGTATTTSWGASVLGVLAVIARRALAPLALGHRPRAPPPGPGRAAVPLALDSDLNTSRDHFTRHGRASRQ